MSNLPSSSVDSVAQSADEGIRSSQRVANSTLDKLAGQVETARAAAGPALDSLTQGASEMANRSTEALRRGAEQVRAQALAARDTTRGYIQQEPLKAVLIAAAAGALIMMIGSLVGRRGPR